MLRGDGSGGLVVEKGRVRRAKGRVCLRDDPFRLEVGDEFVLGVVQVDLALSRSFSDDSRGQ